MDNLQMALLTIKNDSIIHRSKDILSSSVDEETVLLNIDKSSYYGMGSIASRIWNLLEEPIRISSLIEILFQEFDIERQECENDVMEFLNQLKHEKLIDISE